jgi:RimJ/RimL family protein N-acetyltransferase
MKYFKKLIGENCYLSPICPDDIEKYTEWVNDMETGLYVLFAASVIDVNKERNILEFLTNHNIVMAIVEKENNLAIGICGLHNKNDVHKSATYGIFIGDKNFLEHGLGTEATLLMLDYAFHVLNLNSITLEVLDFNKRAIRCCEKCGFKYAGKKRQAIFMAGIYHDLLLYDVTVSEFEGTYISNLYNNAVKTEADNNKITLVK